MSSLMTSERVGFKCGAQWTEGATREQLLSYTKGTPIVVSLHEIKRLPGFAWYKPGATDSDNFWKGFECGIMMAAKMKKMEVSRNAASTKKGRSNSRN